MADAGTYLGFDYGTRRLGVAVGESVTGSARGLETLPCRDGQPDWGRITALVEAWRPVALVVGRPEHADGTAADSTRGAERFARRLGGRTGLTVHTIDERLSSREGEARLRDSGGGRRGRGEGLDAAAAAVILETWFLTQGTP